MSFQPNRNQKNYVNFLVHITGDHANDVNILGRSVHTIKKNTEALVIASKENGLEVNAYKYLLLFVLSHVLIVCTVPLPPGVNQIAVDKYMYLSIRRVRIVAKSVC